MPTHTGLHSNIKSIISLDYDIITLRTVSAGECNRTNIFSSWPFLSFVIKSPVDDSTVIFFMTLAAPHPPWVYSAEIILHKFLDNVMVPFSKQGMVQRHIRVMELLST